MRRRNQILFCIFTAVATSRQGVGFQKPTVEPGPFRWIDASGETEGIAHVTHRLRPLSLQTDTGPPVEIETEETKLDSVTTRITRRAFSASINGARSLRETTVEEIKRMPGDRIQAIRMVSRPDANGHLNLVQEETQEMAPAGTGIYRITRTVRLPGPNSAMEPKEQITQVEKRSGEKSVEIERTRYLPGVNGAWNVAEQRVSRNNIDKDQIQTDEQVFCFDINNRFSLAQQVRMIESKDPAGRIRLQSDSYVPNVEGGLQLAQRMTIVQIPLQGGKQETSQTLEKPGPAAVHEGLRLVRKVVENLQVRGPKETERQLKVLEPDLNGGMRIVGNWQTTEVK